MEEHFGLTNITFSIDQMLLSIDEWLLLYLMIII